MHTAEQPADGGVAGAVSAPAGPVVGLVVTDIEGSTDLWARAPAAMAAALQAHHGVARAHLAARGGYEIKTEGDSFTLAFADPVEALLWCLDVTDAMARLPWPSELRGADDRRGLRLRIGLHVGEPIRVLDPITGRVDYVGPVVNRAVRVAAAGHGGQVLLSDAAWRHLEGRLPEDLAEIEDLGVYSLRGLSAPERLRMVRRAQHTRRPFPPPRASRWRPSSPLAGRDQFVGRAMDLARIHHRFTAGARLLTLKGPGGTGKTRLARRYGAEAEQDWPGGVIFCDLTEARTGEAVVAAAARALQLPSGAGDEQIAEALLGRGRTLFILDNLEQVHREAAPHVAAWLSAPSEAALLVTSRVALRLPGESVLALSPLSLPEAGTAAPEALLSSEAAVLFVERAMERGAALTLDAQTCLDVAALVRRLDGLPLAIELAAAWSRLLSPAALLHRVEVHHDPLRRTGEGRAPRQTTLRAVVEWSWALLRPWEQAAFAQLSVFEGGFSVELAEAVVDLSAFAAAPPVSAVLDRLVDGSLVHRSETGARLHLLATLQDFASERLSATPAPMDRASAERRHGAALIALMARLTQGTSHLRSAPAARMERENLIAATRRALAQDEPAVAWRVGVIAVDLLVLTGPQSEAVQLGRALLRCRGLEPAWRGTASIALGDALRNLGQPVEAAELLERGLADLQDGPEDTQAFALRALRNLGVLAHDRRDHASARARYQTALARAEALGASTERALILTCMGHLVREAGDYDTAEARFREALSWCPREDPWTHWRTQGALALLQLDRGRAADAAPILRQVLDHARAEGDRLTEISAAGNLAGALFELGEVEEALRLQWRNLALSRTVGNRRFMAINLGNTGDMLVATGRHDEAAPLLREAVTLAVGLGLRDAEGAFRGALIEATHAGGATDEAWAELERCAATLAAIPNPLELLRSRIRQLRMARGTDRPTAPLRVEVRQLAEGLGIEPSSPLGTAVEALTGAPRDPTGSFTAH